MITRLVRMWDAKLEKCLFGRLEVELPEVFMEDVNLYFEIMNLQTWQFVLSESQRQHLMNFLPQFPEADESQKQYSLRLLFTGVTFKFGNPLKQFYKKLRNGRFSPEIAKHAVICKKAKEREYRYQQKLYYSSILRDVLTNRQRILDVQFYRLPDDTVKNLGRQCISFAPQQQSLEYRVSEKCYRLVSEVNEECWLTDTGSSTDEDEFGMILSTKSVPKQQLPKRQGVLELSIGPVQDTFASRPKAMAQVPLSSTIPTTGKHKRHWNRTLFFDVSGDHYLFLLHSHKQRKLDSQDHPELDVVGIQLNSVMERVQSTKKSSSNGLHKRKFKKYVRKSVHQFKGENVTCRYGEKDMLEDTKPTGNRLNAVDSDVAKVYDECSIISRSSNENVHLFPHFFSLIKHFICDESDGKISTSKLEEMLCDWQDSDCFPTVNQWRYENSNWLHVLPSAIKFLSSGCADSTAHHFFPMLDFKERLQQWMWIGQGHDTEEELAELHKHWSTHCKDELHNSSYDSLCIVPPSRVWTEYKVKPTTDEQKLTFQAQERVRFNNPTKAFTYRMHGYEAVVGPVKGVYAKDSSMRPRDHSLLVKDRPPYVTILTLVHDGAARLPNGEGTRSQICELLKDSQFLAPSVTDAQINAVVSGALDRLHYEKDPCVKYDSIRKLWIYRHRYRAEDEFERIHKAQGEVALAKKKVVLKPKVSRVNLQKTKDKLFTGSGALSSSIASDVHAFSKIDSNLVPVVNKSVSSQLFPASPCSTSAVDLSSAAMKAQCSMTGSFSARLTMRKTSSSNIASMKQVSEISRASLTPVNSNFPRSEVRSAFMATGLNKAGSLHTSAEPAVQFVLPANASKSVVSCQATASASRFLHPTSCISREKLTNVITMPSTTVFRNIGVKPSLSASSRVITGTTFPRQSPALSTEQLIAIAVPDSSKQNMLIVTRSLSGTSDQSSVTRLNSQLVAGQVIRPVSRPLIVSGQPRSVLTAASGRTLQFVGRPVHLIPSHRGSSSHIVQAVRMSAASDAIASSQIRAATSSLVTSQSIMSHLLQHRPANISLIAHKSTSNEGQVIAEVQNYVRFSHAQASGHPRLSSASLHDHVVASPELNEGIEEKQA